MAIFRREAQPDPAVPTPSSRPAPAPQCAKQVTLVASGSVIEGKIKGETEVLVEGVLQGEVDLASTLVVGEGGTVIGDVVARSVRISGKLQGNVQALDKVELLPTGSIEGDVVSPRVAIAEGGFCKGKIEMSPHPVSEKKPAVEKGPASEAKAETADDPKPEKGAS